MHMARNLWMLMAMPRLMRPVARGEQGASVRKVMIVKVCSRALGRGGVHHEHHGCQKRDRSRQLLPDRRSFRAEGQLFHAAKTPVSRSCSMLPDPSALCPARL